MTQVPSPDLLTAGSIVGPWRIDCRVGRGTYGVVFQATRAGHPESEPVALKVAVHPDDARFGREVELLTRLRHPAVPALEDRGWWKAPNGESHPYVVMQWVDGLSLYEWAKVYNPTSRQVFHVLPTVLCCLGGLWFITRCPTPNGPMEETAQVLDSDKPDAGTAGVGESVSVVKTDPHTVQLYGKTIIGVEVPRQPFHAQIRPDKHGECPLSAQVVINGACWRPVGNVQPPCEESGFEWKDGCYLPVFDKPRSPTSEDP